MSPSTGKGMGAPRDVPAALSFGQRMVRGLAGTPLDPLWIAKRSLRRELERVADQASGRLLDVGCGTKPYRDLFAGLSAYVGIERPGTRSKSTVVDTWADALALPFRDAAFDTVLCNEVLEHVPEPRLLLAESTRVLRAGGLLILSTPQTWGLHEEPFDFYRYTRYGLDHLARASGLTPLEVRATCGTFAMAGQRIVSFLFYSTGIYRVDVLNLLSRAPLALLQLVAVGIDELAGRRGDTLDNVMVARK